MKIVREFANRRDGQAGIARLAAAIEEGRAPRA
jgi:hypothetical protein